MSGKLSTEAGLSYFTKNLLEKLERKFCHLKAFILVARVFWLLLWDAPLCQVTCY